MILVNTPDTGDALTSEYDAVNTVHLPAASRDSLRAYAAAPGATATFAISFTTVEGPKVWELSARGPIRPQLPEVLKPGACCMALHGLRCSLQDSLVVTASASSLA